MKRIIPLAAALAWLTVLAGPIYAQSISTEGAALLAQNNNPDRQATRSDRATQPETVQPAGVQQNRQINNATPLWGYGQSYSYGVRNARFPGAGDKPLIVRTSELNPKDEANLEEDLAVMTHILSKALDDLPTGATHSRSAMGINLFVTPNAEAIRSLYLEGYGALFLFNVGFPVVAPAATAPEEKRSADSAWEEARQELYGQSTEPQSVSAPTEEFSEEKVSRLKETVLRALKNASNIRGLEGDLTVCILGGAHSLPISTGGGVRRTGLGGGSAVNQLLVGTDGAPVQGTVLTIRVSKNDIDAFAKGELKLAEFQQRARVAAYTTAASGAAGVFGLPLTR